AVTGLPGTGGLLATAGGTGALRALGVLRGQSAVFTSAPLQRPVTVVGSSQVRLRVASTTTDATLFVGLWDVAATGAVLPQQLVAPVRLEGLTPGRAVEVDVALPWVVRTLAQGHRLQVVVSSTDQAYAVPRDSRGYTVSLVVAAVAVPTVASVLDTSGTTLAPVGLVVALGLLLVVLAGWLLWRRRGRRRVHRDDSLAAVPLVVSGLVKTYRDRQRAVDDVSWRAEPGQVVGLLGPNGAGKTTTLRMVVGLIRPDAGSVHVLGWPVTPGAAVLGDVGVFIEGPGFLPHLTGRQNLAAYWAATGRPPGEAHLDEALAIAGLGSAVDRRTRAYSQGMRQRLGIAQAMLGLPSLLLLDEPTNGLDPPQILAMRQVLRDYAATGRTVVVSSHLLGEVEQTCSHVVVMHRGRVVTTGSVESLTGGSAGQGLEEVFMQLVGSA
ncbi:MAG: ATP-binding cassette domain-containing protein, partial [Actinomycetota bacterium]